MSNVRNIHHERIRRQRASTVQATEVELETIVPILETAVDTQNETLTEVQRQSLAQFVQKARDEWFNLLRSRAPEEWELLMVQRSTPTAPVTDLSAVPAPEPAPTKPAA